MKILITNIDGYLGKKLYEYFNKNEQLINVYGISKKRQQQNIFKSDLTNITKLKKFFCNVKFDAIIHTAAKTNLLTVDIESSYVNNINCILNVLLLSKIFNIKKIIFFSSFMVYGEEYKVTDTNFQDKPFNWYSKSKLICEQILFDHKDIFEIAILRLPEVIDFDLKKGLIFDLIKEAKKTKEIEIYGSDNYYRCFLYFNDLISFIKQILKNDYKFIFGPLFTEKSITLNDILNIFKKFNIKVKIDDNKKNFNKFVDKSINLLDNNTSIMDIIEQIIRKNYDHS